MVVVVSIKLNEEKQQSIEEEEEEEEMLSACVSSTATAVTAFSLLNCKDPPSSPSFLRSSLSCSRTFNPLSLRPLTRHYGIGSVVKSKTSNGSSIGFRVRCYAPPLTPPNLRWISAASSLVLILARGTAAPKAFIVPLFALQAPAGVIAWIKSTHGMWSAFLALLVRLFFHIPGELELPLIALLLVMVAPYEAMILRDTKEGALVSLLIAVYLAYQHFSRTGLQKSFDQGSIVATLAVICITVTSLLLLI